MTIIYEDYSPVYTGDTLRPFAPVFQDVDPLTGKLSPVDLTGMTLSLRMVSSTGPARNGTGTWTIDNAQQGMAHYTYSAADVSTAGLWTVQTALTNGLGEVVHTDTKLLEIQNPV